MLHYNPRHVSTINMPIFRRTNCIITASGIVTLCVYSMPDESRLLCSLLSSGILYNRLQRVTIPDAVIFSEVYEWFMIAGCWIWTAHRVSHGHKGKMVKLSLYRPGQILVFTGMLRVRVFTDSRHKKVKRLLTPRTSRLYPPRKYSWYSFLLKTVWASVPQCGRK
jgi:hypothetical protein